MKKPNIITEKAELSEQKGSLISEWLDEIYDQKWFKLFVPRALDGLELTFPQALKIEENLARKDGSLGWTVTLCAGAGWFVGFLEESLRKEVFSDPKVCLAGSGFVGGKANIQEDSYLISGHWTYASGAVHATHFTANCEIWENGKAVLDAEGKPQIKAFILTRDEVEILDAWHYMGMVATGSHAFRAENLQVPLNRSFEILPEKAKLSDPIYQFPFFPFAEATLAVNILGISLHLQELIQESFWKRHERKAFSGDQLAYFEKLAKKSGKNMEKIRAKFYAKVEKAWKELEEDQQLSPKSKKSISKISRKMTGICRKLNAELYPFAGLEAAKTETELNRVWRDFNTVSQHSLLTFPF
ncbi:acyl-CoA dehydrogenase family protein [Algoriphagus hitonicola]|uniref:Acyl-CoA dehydrogenase n=1 Tax=Algoriphagus hitonicola TaxID=435880 RepID=A0A1I2PF89_9BACT|nr:acyl-CoA dehydrogenase [Algoriphagus hitonicola]SFG13809.1 Acyl-CoA dehydrogenase [Algoriphagus hitonicola]